ncbi:MAG: DUF434 domain-containing protein [bacterium]
MATQGQPLFSPAFHTAAAEYRWMLDRGYPARRLVKLVGDRHRLTAEARSALFRGVLSIAESEATRRRLLSLQEAQGRRVVVDGHNVLFSVAHYLRGVPVYRATDGLVRDVGGTARRLNEWALVEQAVDALVETAARAGLQLDVLLDAPMDFSKEHARRFRDGLARHGVAGVVEVVASADRVVLARLGRAGPGTVLSSGDAEVVRRCGAPLLDLARETLRRSFNAEIPEILREE